MPAPVPATVVVDRLVTEGPTIARYACAVVLVGVGAALFAIAFRTLLAAALGALYGAPDVVTAFHGLSTSTRLLCPVVGGLCAGLCARVVARFRGGHGVGDVMEAVVLGRGRISLGMTLVKACGSWSSMAAGASIGREGPLIQFGGGLGDALGRLFDVGVNRGRALIAAGTAAGFAAAYNTPLAAILFVLEVVTGVAALEATLPTLVATTIATVLTRAVVGGGPIYGQRTFAIGSSIELVGHAALGVLAAVVAQLFMRLLARGEQLFAQRWLPQPARAMLGGLGVGSIAVVWPDVVGNGFEPLNLVLGERLPLALVALLLGAKMLATTSSMGSGSPGGVFTPTLFLGAALGSLVGHGMPFLVASALGPVGGYALVGMAAMTAATTHAPIMSAVLVFELSGDYAIVLPLLLATAFATVVSRRLRPDSIYKAELRRRGVSWDVTLEGRQVHGPTAAVTTSQG